MQLETQVIKGRVVDVASTGELWQNQQEAVNILMQYDMGIMEVVPGFDKAAMALYMIARRTVSTLAVVPNKEVQKQWKQRVHESLTTPPGKSKRDPYIGVHSSPEKKLRGHLDITVAVSLTSLEDTVVTLREYGIIIVDECHHATSDILSRALRNISVRYI